MHFPDFPNGTFLVSSSSTAADIRDLDDNGLIWRVSSADTQQGNTLAYFALVLALEMQGTVDAVRIVAVHTQNIYGNGLRESFETSLNAYKHAFTADLSHAGLELEFDAVTHNSDTDSEAWNSEVSEIIGQLEEKKPQILLFVGYERTADILIKLQQSDILNTVPLLLTDGASSSALATAYQAESDLPATVFGVQPGYRTGRAYEHFFELYGESVLPTWTEYTYDAVYLLAYAAAATNPNTIDGEAFSQAFERFADPIDGRVITIGPDHFIAASQDMANGLTLDVHGASGPLDFDTTTGEPESVGILRWKVGFSSPEEPGEIVDCGLAMVHGADAPMPKTYWCNAQCEDPPKTNAECNSGYCEDEREICAGGLCTGRDDCRPDHAPGAHAP